MKYQTLPETERRSSKCSKCSNGKKRGFGESEGGFVGCVEVLCKVVSNEIITHLTNTLGVVYSCSLPYQHEMVYIYLERPKAYLSLLLLTYIVHRKSTRKIGL